MIITHEMGVVREVCDTVTLLENGRVAQTGTLLEGGGGIRRVRCPAS